MGPEGIESFINSIEGEDQRRHLRNLLTKRGFGTDKFLYGDYQVVKD